MGRILFLATNMSFTNLVTDDGMSIEAVIHSVKKQPRMGMSLIEWPPAATRLC